MVQTDSPWMPGCHRDLPLPSASVTSPPAGHALGTCSAASDSPAPAAALAGWSSGSEALLSSTPTPGSQVWVKRKTGSISTKPVLLFK